MSLQANMVELVYFNICFKIYVDYNNQLCKIIIGDPYISCDNCIFSIAEYYYIHPFNTLKKLCITIDPYWHDHDI